MHPQDFKSISDHLYEAFCNLHEELHRLKRDNKILNEELAKSKNLNSFLNLKLYNTTSTPVKIIKMGSEWMFDGEKLLSLSMVRKFKFPSPITRARISSSGHIAFSCNKKIFLFLENVIYLIEDTVVPFDPSSMTSDLVDFSKNLFEFCGDELVIASKNSITGYRGLVKTWSIPVHTPVCMCASQGMVYVATKDYKVYAIAGETHEIRENSSGKVRSEGGSDDDIEGIFPKPDSYETIDTRDFIKETLRETVRGIVGSDSGIVLYSDSRIGHFDSKTIKTENFKIFSVDLCEDAIIYGGGSYELKYGRIGSSFDINDSISFKSCILSVKYFRNLIFASTQERMVSVIDPETKKTMKIVLDDNVIDISCNEDQICFVDNNGGLRVFECF